MSGSRSFLQRTEDLKRLKARALYLEDEYGVGPGPNTVPHFGSTGAMEFTNVKIVDSGNSVDIPGDLSVGGTIDIDNLTITGATMQDLSSNHIWTNTEVISSRLDICGSAAVLGGLSIGQAHGIHELDVAGHVFVQSDGSATRTFTVPGIYNIQIPRFVSRLQVELIGAGGNSANGGGGGYIRGTVDVSGFGGQILTIQVGGLGSGLCFPSSSSYLTFLPSGPLLTVAGAGGNGFNGVLLGVIAAGGNGGGGVFDASGIANGTAGAISSVDATSGGGGTSVGGTAAASPPGTIVYQTPQPGQGRPIPENYIEASGGTGGFNESCGQAGGSGYAGGGQGLFAAKTSGQFLAGGGGGGSSFVSSRVSNIVSFAGGSVPTGVMSGYGRGNQGGCVIITYTDIPSLQTSGDIVCGGNLRVDGQITGPLDVSGTMSVDILNVRKYINDINSTTSISTDIVRALNIIAGTESSSYIPRAALDVSGSAQISGDVSCNRIDAQGASIMRSTLNVSGVATFTSSAKFNSGLEITSGAANVRTIEFATTSGTSGLYFDGLNLYFNGMMIEMTNPASYLFGMTMEYYKLPSGSSSSFVPFARETYGDLDYTLTKNISPPTTNSFNIGSNYDSSLYLVVLSGWFKPSVTDNYSFTTALQYGLSSAYSDYYLYINGNIVSGPTSASNSARTLTAGVYYKVDVFFRFTMPGGFTPISEYPTFSWTPTTGAMYTKG